MARSYFGSRISDSIVKKPDGSIVCLSVPIARTGWQEYKISELPQDRAADLGIDVSNPSATIQLYRAPEEVFDPDTMASFEGAPITDNHPPGQDFVNTKNFADYARGHVQNVRRGKDPLESGEWPLLADLVISSEPLVSEILDNRKREVSCGYDYGIDRDGDTVEQVSMLGNHVAVVPKGRAGAEARINDAAPQSEQPAAVLEVPVVPDPEPVHPPKSDPPKEKKPMKLSIMSLFGRGLQSAAKEDNADPESLAAAALELSKVRSRMGSNGNGRASARDEDPDSDNPPEIHNVGDADEDDEEERGEDRRVADRRARDRRARDTRVRDRRADDRRARDIEMPQDPIGYTGPGAGPPPAVDEERDRMHETLDRMIDRRAKDDGESDISELRALLDNYLQEEEHEPQHQETEGGDLDPDLIPETGQAQVYASDDDEEDYDEEDRAEDDDGDDDEEEAEVGDARVGDRRTNDRRAGDIRADDIEGFEDASGFHPIRGSEGYKRSAAGEGRRKRRKAKDTTRAADAANAARSVLLSLRPMVARSKDAALVKAFNAQMRRAKGSSFDTGSGGGYGAFGRAANDRSRAADSASRMDAEDKRLQDYYNSNHNKKLEVK